MQLPHLTRRRLDQHLPGRADFLSALVGVEIDHGYVQARARDRELFLFLREGRVWSAGTREGGSLGALPVRAFAAASASFEDVMVHETDLPLFLCAAVLFRKAPAAHMPAALVDGEALLKSLRALGKDAVLAVQRQDAWALAFCRSGEPVALYAAPALAVPEGGSVQDRLMELVYAAPHEVTLDLYDEIRLPPAADAGQPVSALAASWPPGAVRPTLVVMIGERVVFRHLVDQAETVIGRGLSADLALDNLSISRRHAVVRLRGDRLVIQDLGSENGLTLAGARVDVAELGPGDRVGVGKYTLVYALGAVTEASPEPRQRAASADIETVTLTGKGAVLEHDGRRVPVASAVFTIGSAEDAHLRIRGIFVAHVHAVLQIDGDGYRVDHAGGRRALLVNGAVTKRARLADGDELVIAGEKIRFWRSPTG